MRGDQKIYKQNKIAVITTTSASSTRKLLKQNCDGTMKEIETPSPHPDHATQIKEKDLHSFQQNLA